MIAWSDPPAVVSFRAANQIRSFIRREMKLNSLFPAQPGEWSQHVVDDETDGDK